MSEQIQHCNDGFYYIYEGIVYIGTFPEEWAKNHLPDTGPHECENCVSYGTVQNVFIGYCANCADYEYEGSRGKGFMDTLIEDITPETDDGKFYRSAFDTYLKDINVDNINIEDIYEEYENSPYAKYYDSAFHEDPSDEYEEHDFNNDDDGRDMTVFNICHYEGGYNDW
jgi:hypothetical protein